jgi:hypothetical protein
MKDTIEMAREVKATAYTNRHYPDRTTYTFNPEQLKAFEALVRSDEREACARLCEDFEFGFQDDSVGSLQGAATAIRARGEAK